jgi:hypothetical protein
MQQPSRRPLGVLLVGSVVLALPNAAQATRVTLAVRPADQRSRAAAASLEGALRQALGQSGREVRSPDAALGLPGQREAARALRSAAAKLQRGRSAFETLEMEEAAARLTQVIEAHEKNAAFVADLDPVIEAAVLLAAINMLTKNDVAARAWLRRAFALRPDLDPDDTILNPQMQETFRDERAEAGEARGDMAVQASPGGTVYIDGILRGEAPVTATGLVEGTHFVRILLDGHTPWGRTVDIVGGATAAIQGRLSPTDDADSTGAADALTGIALGRLGSPAVRELADALGTPQLLAVAVARESNGSTAIRATLFGTRTGAALGIVETTVEASDGEKASAALSKLVADLSPPRLSIGLLSSAAKGYGGRAARAIEQRVAEALHELGAAVSVIDPPIPPRCIAELPCLQKAVNNRPLDAVVDLRLVRSGSRVNAHAALWAPGEPSGPLARESAVIRAAQLRTAGSFTRLLANVIDHAWEHAADRDGGEVAGSAVERTLEPEPDAESPRERQVAAVNLDATLEPGPTTPPTPAERPAGGPGAAAWVTLGAGLAVAASGGGIAYLNHRTLNDSESLGDEKEAALTYRLAGIIAAAIGGVAAAIGATTVALSD